jgi:pimeloyl-ACP methyl ester carboxylesterase
MRRVEILFLLLFACLFSANRLQAQTPSPPPSVNRNIPHFPRKPSAPQAVPLVRRAEVAGLPALAAKNVSPISCSTDAQSAGASLCGYVNVPLNRELPSQGTIPIYFELYLHSASGPAQSAILGNFGGPGVTTTGLRGYFLYIFGPNLDVHDLLLIDDRGRGLSGTIDCQNLQYGYAAFDPALAECAAQLGNADSRYGTGDIAMDTDAVRAALGYEKIDYYGGSYGGADVTAYATRFGEHLRSIVLDAPFGTPAADEAKFALEQYRTQADGPTTSWQCQRSPLCSADHPFPEIELNLLIWAVRLNPVKGSAYDANGNLKQVQVDESALLNFVLDNPTGNFTSTGEVFAAASSLLQGDSLPLLRLGAEGYFPVDYANNGDPTYFSLGAELATACVDAQEPWIWSDPVTERAGQFADAVSDLPTWYFAPFSKPVATGLIYDFFGRDCLNWQKPTLSSPIAPPYAMYPLAPALVLTGDLDRRVPHAEVSKVAALFPNSTLVSVENAGHETVLWTQCADNLASEFVETAQVPDTSCASTPEIVWPAVGRFPELAKGARPADIDPAGQNEIGVEERKVVTVAVATATDALQRSIIGSGTGVGLRGGTFSTNYSGPVWVTNLNNCAFASDVIVNGTVTWAYEGSFTADLTVSGPGTAGGSLTVTGTWEAPVPVGNFSVTGTLGGKQVAVLVPEA